MKRSGSGALDLGGLTPLLDTVFLLLFALLTLSRNAEVTELVRVELPVVDPEGDASAGSAPRLVLVVDAASRVRLPAAPAGDEREPEADLGRVLPDRDALDAALADALQGPLEGALPEEIVVEIQADAGSKHGVSVELLQHLRLAGFCQVELLATGGASGGAFGAIESRETVDGQEQTR